MGSAALRDHAAGMLRDIAVDLRRTQTRFEQAEKSKGRAPLADDDTQAARHGEERVSLGFTINEVISEFRALRASVLHLWGKTGIAVCTKANAELIRFNEAIDQALANSLARFTSSTDENTRRFDTLLSSSPDLHYIIGADTRLIYANQALSNQFAGVHQDIIGLTLEQLCPALAPHLIANVRKVLDTGEALRAEACVTGPDGADVTYRYVFLPIVDDAGRIDSITGTARNISELKASEEEIYKRAYFDGLTQLPNRALFLDRLSQGVKHANRTGIALALLFIDLDGFKEVNDRLGHAAGDQLLKTSAERIGACVRGTDTVARIGGDEFTVILSEIGDLVHVEALAQTILDELAKPFVIGLATCRISGSMGITVCPQDARTPDSLLRNADQAMYVAKRAGCNQYSFFTSGMRDSAWARLQSIDELRQALVHHQLEVYYQPIVDLQTGVIVKAEALVRWHHPRRGLVLPDSFIGLAEQTGLIGEIGAWVLAEAVEHARQWSALLGRPFQVSVNKSPVELMSATRMHSWQSDLDALGDAGVPIAIEITEGVLLNDSSAVREWFSMLKQAGVQFAIDDFGIGYSSMSYLKKFEIDFVKIDQSFVKDMLHSTNNCVFAEMIIVMAHKLGLRVIAEGVETVEQRDWLRANQCDYAQGFLYSEAATSTRFTDMLAAGQGDHAQHLAFQ